MTWFVSVLRDGVGLAAAGASRPFAEVAAGVLAQAGVTDVNGAIQQVMAGMQELHVHRDLPEGVRPCARA